MKQLIRIFMVLCLFLYSCQGYKNEKRLKNVKVGMTKAEVKKIMGEPIDSFHSTRESKDNIIPLVYYQYEAPFASSDNIKIIFNDESAVVLSIQDGS